MKNKWILTGLIVVLFIFIFTVPLRSSNINNLPDPFQNYKNKENNHKTIKVENTVKEKNSQKTPEKMVTDENKTKFNIPFTWKGLISYNNQYIALISTQEGSKLLKTGETFKGYILEQISLDKLVFIKDNNKVVLTLGGGEQ